MSYNLQEALQQISNFASHSQQFKTGLTEFEVTNMMRFEEQLKYFSWNKLLVERIVVRDLHELSKLNQFYNIQYLSFQHSVRGNICLNSSIHLLNLKSLFLTADFDHIIICEFDAPKLQTLFLSVNSCTFSENQYFPSLSIDSKEIMKRILSE